MGTEGTYYVSEKDLTKDNAGVILAMAETDGLALVNLIVDVSVAGRAPKQNPTLFALAACCASSDDATRQAAFAAIPQVCRTGTMLFIFARYVEQFRGWGRGLRRAVGRWYTAPSVENVAFQAVKYRQREGWSHRDLLRLAHPLPGVEERLRRELFDWICRGTATDIPIIEGYRKAQETHAGPAWAHLVEQYGLSWEMLPDAALKEPAVWSALLPKMGLTALVRNLGRLTNLGVLKALGDDNGAVIARLTDAEQVRKARLHPLKVLDALKTYSSGHGFRGGLTWTPVPQLVDALEQAFYLAFGAVVPAGKRTMIALDVSGSMTQPLGNSLLSCREASAAMAMVTVRTEPQYLVTAFSGGMIPLTITAGQSLRDVVNNVSNLPFNSTDCALPMLFAVQEKLAVETFIVLTDNETWSGRIHSHEALRQYRQKSGIDARLAVIGMTATAFSIADPKDPGQMDVVGFDTSTPDLIAGFSRRDF